MTAQKPLRFVTLLGSLRKDRLHAEMRGCFLQQVSTNLRHSPTGL